MKWTETRSEHMTSTIHGRDQIDYVKIGAKRDGTITGLECTAICDLGAYFETLTPFIPCFTGFVISGCYKIPNLKFTAKGVFTNKMATDATRGAGRPEATHLIEVSVEQLGGRARDGLAGAPAQELHPGETGTLTNTYCSGMKFLRRSSSGKSRAPPPTARRSPRSDASPRAGRRRAWRRWPSCW